METIAKCQPVFLSKSKRQWLFIASSFILLVVVLVSGLVFTRAHANEETFSGNNKLVQLSDDPYVNDTTALHKTGYEPASYSYGSTIVTTYQMGRFLQFGGSLNLGWATSIDGGRHWTKGLLPGITKINGGEYERVSNAWVAYNTKEKVWIISYIAFNVLEDANTDTTVAVSKSHDGGLTWSEPTIVSKEHELYSFFDMPRMACDIHEKSPFYGNCYILWNDSSVFISVSTDGGDTWSEKRAPYAGFHGVSGQLIVQLDGKVVIVNPDERRIPFSAPLATLTSVDGGKTWSEPVTIADQFVLYPNVVMDAEGTLYIIWSGYLPGDQSNGNAVFMIRSTDGIHWSSPQIILKPLSASVSYDHVALAIDTTTAGKHAHLGLTYYKTVSSEASVTTQAFFVSSKDGGETWGKEQALTQEISTDWLVPFRTIGDYVSIVFNQGKAFPFIVNATEPDSQGKYKQHIYTVEKGLN